MAAAKMRLDTEWRELYEFCDSKLSTGEVGSVVEKMAEVSPAAVPRPWIAKTAQLFLRAGQFARGLTLLSPVVRSDTADPSEIESAVYALLLIKIGSIDEGMSLLRGLPGKIPETFLYLAFGHQASWDYFAAAPLLQRVANWEEIDLYTKTVAQVNLLASLVAIKNVAPAKPLLRELMARTLSHNWMMLHSNLKELSAQLALAENDLELASKELSLAIEQFQSGHRYYDFLIKKWRAIVSFRRDPGSRDSRARLMEIREQALAIRHWESVRECDRILALATRSEDLFFKLFFGTPFSAYRKSLLEESGSTFKIPEQFVYGPRDGLIFDLQSASSSDGAISLKPWQTQHRCLVSLASDLYKPAFLGQLHNGVFPGEYFNWVSSPARVYNVVKRLRKWIEGQRLGITIEVNDNLFRLKWLDNRLNVGLRYSGDVESHVEAGSMGVSLRRLKTLFGAECFTSEQAAKALGISRSSVAKLLAWGVNAGSLNKRGRNRSTVYSYGEQ